MSLLILGLVLFLGVHSLRIFAEGWRNAQLVRLGEQRWKGIYSLASLAGFVLLVWGFGEARAAGPALYAPPAWARHTAALFTLPAFVRELQTLFLGDLAGLFHLFFELLFDGCGALLRLCR